MTARKTFTASEDLIGKYINKSSYSDVRPIGKITGIKSKTVLMVQPVREVSLQTQLEFIEGGFAGHCVNQDDQDWSFEEYGEIFEMKIKASNLDKSIFISNRPRYYYDYNF